MDDTSAMTTASVVRQYQQISGPMIGLTVGCLAAVIMLLLGFYLFLRRYRLKRAKSMSYEQMGGEYNTITQAETSSLAPVSMKQIPFTVPSTGMSTTARRSDSRFLDETSTGSGSEPASPTALKRPSVEIPGAYALGSIDPSLYKICDEDDDYEVPEDHIGRVWFAVEYERESEKLLVTLIKAKNLPNRSFGNVNSCDPFVRIFLMPDERRYLQSKFRKKTCNPKFEESYVFQVSYKAIQDRILKLTVFDVDRHKRHNVIGHALYPLREHDCEVNERVVVWRDLEKEVTETTSDRGEVLISICYNDHMERLTVGVFEGRGFKKPETCSSVDSYMKVSLLLQNKVIKTKKTEVIKKTSDPNFNESFTFKLQAGSLDTASVTVSALQHISGHKDKLIGRVVLGSFMFARGKELEHWNEMVANQKEQITQWHVLT